MQFLLVLSVTSSPANRLKLYSTSVEVEPLCWPLLGRTAWTTLPQLPSHNSKNDSISSFLSFQTIDLTCDVGEDELDVGGAFVEGVGRQVAVEDAGVVVSEIVQRLCLQRLTNKNYDCCRSGIQ